MDTTNQIRSEVADPDEVVDELIAYDAAEVRRATATTQSVPVATVRRAGWSYSTPPDDFTD
ncbi:hypothetical protein GCM10023216_14190 [Isoptericola chiayiensis]|uniref:Uncharacterized protein n=1 Tax=Isoptericola chiayiensis TaxID=579446 RepID=A0ABP8YD10_9MICO|nr:hypothetical protein [Isoptericola chiayiensis]NOW02050.1 hypothetical protein [Isoptericola chiayiensis]